MDISADIVENMSLETVVTIGTLFCSLFVLGIAADVFLIVRYLAKPPRIGELARQLRSRPWTWREFVLISLSLAILHVSLAAFLHDLGINRTMSDATVVRSIVLTAFVFQGTAMLLIGYLMIRRRLSPRQAFGAQLANLPRDAARGLLSYLAVIVPLAVISFVYVRVLHAAGCEVQPQTVIQILLKTDSPLVAGILAFLAVVAAPVVEEIVFRGIALPFFARHMSVGTAVVLVSLLFALIHANVVAFVPIFILAIGLSLGYIATGSLTVPIVTHACFNAVSLAASLLFKDIVA